jgi:hypothetical protein
MPEMEIHWPDGIGIDFIWLQIWGYLGWPADENERAARIGRYFLRQLAVLSQDEFTIMNPMPVTYNLRAAGPEVRKQLFASSRRACLEALDEFGSFRAVMMAPGNSKLPMNEVLTTGFVLLVIRSIEERYPDLGGSSISKAVCLAEDLARKQKEGVLIKNERDIRRAWGKYKNVAHLAAASVFLGLKAKVIESLETGDNLPVFLSIAKSFENFGTTFYSHARKNTLLDQETIWSVPKRMLPADSEEAFTIPLEETDIAFLSNYRV